MSRNDAKEMVKSMLANKSSGNNSSNSDKERSGWRKGLNMAEQLHVMVSAGINPDNDETSVDSRQIKKHKKAARKYCSKKGTRSR